MWRVKISASLLYLEKKEKLKDPVCWKDVELHIVVVVVYIAVKTYSIKELHASAYVSIRPSLTYADVC